MDLVVIVSKKTITKKILLQTGEFVSLSQRNRHRQIGPPSKPIVTKNVTSNINSQFDLQHVQPR